MELSGICTFRDTTVTVEHTVNGQRTVLLVSCDGDGQLTVADLDSDVPRFIERRRLTVYPTDAAILRVVEAVLGGPQRLVAIAERNVELDRSALFGLKKMPVDIFDNVYLGEVKERALCLCVDIRNFSNFLCSNDEDEVFRLIKEFTSNLLSCVNQFGYGCSYYKLMGDGAIVIWDETTPETVAAALSVFDSYIEFLNEDLFKPHPELGMAGALVADKVFKYEISAEASQLKYRDYVGYGINLACRLQALARKDELVVNQALADGGLVPFDANRTPSAVFDLRALKGLKDEDRQQLLVYKRA
jgi:class 3 adenylate cyclase